MTELRHLHRYERIDGPYDSVCACLHRFFAAGDSAPVLIHEMAELSPSAGLPGRTRVTLSLRDDAGRRHFESAEIYVSPASDAKTHIELDCHPVCRAPEPMPRAAVDAHFRELMDVVFAAIQRELRSIPAAPRETRPQESAR
jgi:hypothetical protein